MFLYGHKYIRRLSNLNWCNLGCNLDVKLLRKNGISELCLLNIFITAIFHQNEGFDNFRTREFEVNRKRGNCEIEKKKKKKKKNGESEGGRPKVNLHQNYLFFTSFEYP